MERKNKHYNVVITGPAIAQKAMKILSILCTTKCTEPYLPPEELFRIVRDFRSDAILVRTGKITSEVIGASPDLKVISKHGTGVDNIDISSSTRLKIPVLIAASANYESVAEHVLAMMLALAKSIPTLDARIRLGHWDKPTFKGVELKTKSLGLIGFGRIGRRVYELVRPLDMKVMVYDPFIKREEVPKDIIVVEMLKVLLESSDIVSLHCPLDHDTKHLIDREEFQIMKKTSWLINTARGEIVNESALVSAIERGDIAAAAIDTFTIEPPSASNPLLESDRVILTPHVAGMTEESFERMGIEASKHILSVLEGNAPDPACLVNPASLTTG